MSFSDIITLFFLVFLVLGAIDKCIGNKLGLGDGFEQGFNSAGGLILAMVGMNSFAFLLAKWLQPVLNPIFTSFGADPSAFAGLIMGNDMGGYALATKLAENPTAGSYSGLLVASIMGCLIVFTIPVGFSSVTPEKRHLLVKGLLIGMVTVPIGLMAGGLFSGLSITEWFLNTVPVLVLALILIICMFFIQKVLVKIMMVFGKILSVLLIVTLVIAIMDKQLDFIHIDGLISYDDGIYVVGSILIVLAGAFPFLNTIRMIFKKPLQNLAKKSGMNEDSLMGLLTIPINSIPAFASMNKMSDRGIIVNAAAAVSMSFVIGDHLAFTMSVEPEKLPMVLIGKGLGGITAMIIALISTRKLKNDTSEVITREKPDSI